MKPIFCKRCRAGSESSTCCACGRPACRHFSRLLLRADVGGLGPELRICGPCNLSVHRAARQPFRKPSRLRN